MLTTILLTAALTTSVQTNSINLASSLLVVDYCERAGQITSDRSDQLFQILKKTHAPIDDVLAERAYHQLPPVTYSDDCDALRELARDYVFK